MPLYWLPTRLQPEGSEWRQRVNGVLVLMSVFNHLRLACRFAVGRCDIRQPSEQPRLAQLQPAGLEDGGGGRRDARRVVGHRGEGGAKAVQLVGIPGATQHGGRCWPETAGESRLPPIRVCRCLLLPAATMFVVGSRQDANGSGLPLPEGGPTNWGSERCQPPNSVEACAHTGSLHIAPGLSCCRW